MKRAGAGMMRLRGLVRKEFLQIVRDPSSIGIAFFMPVVLLLLFGYGVSLDAHQVPIAVVVENPSVEAERFVAAFRATEYFDVHYADHMDGAIESLAAGHVDGIVRLRTDFAASLRDPDGGGIQVILDGVDANTARIISGYTEGIWQRWLMELARGSGRELASPISLEPRIWFNAELRSRNFLVPGLVAVIMTLIGALLTALVMAREWERGTMEALMVTPVTVRDILLGKLIPYFLLGMGGMALSVAMAVWLFQVPLRGSLAVLFAASSLFLLAALGMGLLISAAARNQFVAGQAAIIATFLPAFILSGFIFDIHSMPVAIQFITYAVAARYFVAILQSLFLAGDVWSVIVPNALALLAMAVFFLGMSRRRTKKRLE